MLDPVSSKFGLQIFLKLICFTILAILTTSITKTKHKNASHAITLINQ